jgi:hypothetical protein
VNVWSLQTILLILDEQGEAVRHDDVTQTPTTLLIGADERVLQRLEGVTRPAELAFEVQRTLSLSP